MPRLRVGDIELYYEITGKGQPILLIHGLGSGARDWGMQAPFLSQNFQVVTFDVRGHGQSDKPPGPYSIPLFAADTIELIRSLELAPVHIVGISMGGMIAFQVALEAPEMVKSLVIVNSGPEFVLRSPRDIIRGLQRLLIVRLFGMRRMGEALSKSLFPKEEQGELRRLFVERWAENDRQAYINSMRAIVGWSVADRLGEIDCPSLIIAADQDYTPVSLKETYVARMPQAELVVIADSRHATPVEHPEQFNKVLMEFLSKQV
jgi:pimeloyl-ACP methyl ester carboxylesterase